MASMTAAAAAKVAELASADGTAAVLRLAVRPGGCSGFSYEMFFADEEPGDAVVDVDGVRLVVDPTSAPLVEAAVVDFADGLSGGFRVSNRSAARTCGCGQSFS